ncbi:hypothetical protein, partial [Bradyrhizobium sp. 33ap4]|uniref:hypothetical protein n=1 Tax=Bradyrhizobium sp. 33ap4 TaxID=3061630 RepID=UPI002931875E
MRFSQECTQYAGAKKVSLEKLKIQCDDDVNLALWEKGDVITKTLKAPRFLAEVRKSTATGTSSTSTYATSRGTLSGTG